ncbi:MAG: hypothetical protein JWM80_5901 [Cyanobacteria bacterium RYN_339]|nr:hypothetical protein [Cyanobacteria bacterium RYN_339]
MWGELKSMLLAPLQHPLATLATVGLAAGLVMAAPLVGITAAAVGNAMLAGFGALALWRMGRGAAAAVSDFRRGDTAKAEADFEGIGAGGADLVATVGPAAAGRAISLLRKTEASRAVVKLAGETEIGHKLAVARRSVFGKLKVAPGQGEKLGQLNGLRERVAQSGVVKAFNKIFDTAPNQVLDAVEGKALTRINYSKAGRGLRDKALIKAAERRGQSVEELIAKVKARRVIPTVTERSTEVSPVLQRGPVPTSAADMEFLIKQQKVKTIVTLLHPASPEEGPLLAAERALAAKYGVTLIELQLPFGMDPPAAMVNQYLAAVDAATPEARVYVHCRLGRDRTGTMVALYRQARQGLSGEAALAEMKTFGFKPEHETYLSYLANYVLGYMGRGALDVRKLLLRGDAGSAAGVAARTAAATLPRGKADGG